MHPKPEPEAPANFPRYTELEAVAGVQPKYAARLVGGKYVVGLTVQEFYSRYTVSHDMVNQLVDLCQSELDERKNVDVGALFREVKVGVAGKWDWGFTDAERHWLMVQLCARMGWPSPE